MAIVGHIFVIRRLSVPKFGCWSFPLILQANGCLAFVWTEVSEILPVTEGEAIKSHTYVALYKHMCVMDTCIYIYICTYIYIYMHVSITHIQMPFVHCILGACSMFTHEHVTGVVVGGVGERLVKG